jgi:SNF2 family DNA or RNA helicase
VLVFVRSRMVQDSLAAVLPLALDLPPVGIFNGERSMAERQAMVQQFAAASGPRVLLVSPEVGGAGWNLQFAARSVLLERPYNPAVEDQVIARTWRLGQRRPVEVVAPLAVLDGVTTFDELLNGLLEEKRALATSVLAPAAVQEGELSRRFSGLFTAGVTPIP